MIIDLTGKTAVVTGGYGAIGAAMCEYYVKSGAQVVVVGRNEKKGEEFAKHLRDDLKGDAIYHYGDVSDKVCMEQLCADVIKKYGKIDILVNNAGINVGPEGRAHIEDFDDDSWHKILKTDLDGVYYCSKPIIKEMKKRKYGRIINIASIVGEVALRNQCAFNAAKAGVIHLTKAMAIELAEDGINVNCICPGSIMFEGTAKLFYDDKAAAERLLSHIPMHRPGKPEDIAGMTVMLSSDEISYMTGDVVTIDGGWVAGYARDF